VPFDPKVTRRELLKAGAQTALLGLVGCGESQSTGSPADDITQAAIHPAIGVARIGNSATDFYLGPELPGALPSAAGGFKDGSGAIKRQAARFRIYGLDADGRVVRELTADDAAITWSVHLSNRKAAWYNFQKALDIPEAVAVTRRNTAFKDSERARLVIDPGAREISGRGARGVMFDGGTFIDSPAELGELRTDAAGRLLVLGGTGRSFAPLAAPLKTYSNNDGWCDDIADGPVTATVRYRGRNLAVDPAWAIVAPPNYAPGIATGFRTLYDVITQTMVDAGYLAAPSTTTFVAHIFPLFDRLAQLQWVNQGMLERFGWKSPDDFLAPDYLRALADPSPGNAAFRRSLFTRFRHPNLAVAEPDALPPIYGDAFGGKHDNPRNWIAVTPLQFEHLSRWADGAFVDDLDADRPAPRVLEDLPIATQGAALDRAALDACLGEAFDPGCEASWPMRIASLYAGPFRLRHRAEPEADYGDQLTPQVALSADGPLNGCGPGDVTRWMAVPWQTDSVSCGSGFNPTVDPYLPTFWAARVPNHVLTEEAYLQVTDAALPLEQRQQAFATRAPYFRDIEQTDRFETLNRMVENWFRLGLISDRSGVPNGEFPAILKVETGNGFSD